MKALDRRWLYLALLAAVLFPLFRPIGLPVRVGTFTRTVYDYLDKLGPNDIVLFASDYGPGTAAENQPIGLAVAQHLIKNGVKLIIMAFVPEGPMYSRGIVEISLAAGYRYGEDVVDLGYLPGGEMALASFFAGPKKAVPKDTRGTSTDTIPLLAGIETINDVSAIFHVATGVPGSTEYVRQNASYGVPLTAGMSMNMMTMAMAYVQAGQVVGIIPGLQGAAEYESLTGKLGFATVAMDSQSLAYLLYIGAILLGNVYHFTQRKPRPTGQTGGSN
ncbi:MAG: hypothetical protein Q8P50_08845 [Bacillota bacterium]|nr:hypothetical protein [Bacillota bacterium]